MSFDERADAVLAGSTISGQDALSILQAPDTQLLEVVAAAARIRRAYFQNRVKVNYLVNLKSGLCPEDCSYCSQALGSSAPILKYSWLAPEEAVRQAAAGIDGGATRVCLVASGRGPGNRDIDRVSDIVSSLKVRHPHVEVCACLGLLRDGQAERLCAAGVEAYNHNVNTAESFHDEIVRTHTYRDRTDTIAKAKASGLSPCSGLIVGLGESDEQIVEALFALRDLGSDSIPVNFLVPFEGTPLEGKWELTPARCLKIVALARFICADREVRLAGGREIHLRSLQSLALHVANSIFLGDYLTAEGQAAAEDLDLIADNGFVIEGHEDERAPGGHRSRPSTRRRGAGTPETPNV